MLYRPLGATGMRVSEIGFGAASYWGLPQFAEADALALVHAALDGGVTFFDTGPGYSKGQAEPRLGRALRGKSDDALVIATKAGTRYSDGRMVRDFSPQAIEGSAIESLGRLGLERIPLLQLHGPGAAELNDSLLERMERMRERGLVRAFGVNSFDPLVIEKVIGLSTFDVVMIDYNVMRPEREALIARASAAAKGVLAGMALGMGHTRRQVLRIRRAQDVWYALRALKNHRADIARGARFAFLEQTPGLSGAQAALGYVLANQSISCAVTGTTRMAHLLENISASGTVLPAETMHRIRSAQKRIA